MRLAFPFDAKLKNGLSVQLLLAGNQGIEPLRSLYPMMVEEPTSYLHAQFQLVSRQGRGVVLYGSA